MYGKNMDHLIGNLVLQTSYVWIFCCEGSVKQGQPENLILSNTVIKYFQILLQLKYILFEA